MKSNHPQAVNETRLRVRYAETDQMGVVYHSNHFIWFEVGRVELLRQLGFSYRDMESAGRIASSPWPRPNAAIERRYAMTKKLLVRTRVVECARISGPLWL